MERREFMTKSALGVVMITMTPQLMAFNKKSKQKKETLRDRLWMWGHEPETIVGTHNIPMGKNIGIADAIKSMGIPNVCVITFGDVPELPLWDEYCKQFNDTKKVAWSIMYGPERKYTHSQLAEKAFKLTEKMPNLNEFYLDDFFDYMAPPDEITGLAKSYMSIEKLKTLKSDMQKLKRKSKLTMVLYTHQLNPGIKQYLEYCDRVSLWTWWANDLSILENNFRKYREFMPDKPTLLGIYMWDFGNEKPIPLEDMKVQLDFAYEKLKTGEVDGLIFHCTPLCDLDIEAVHYSRQWIADHGDEKWNFSTE